MTITDLSQRIQARDGAAWVIYTKPNCQPCRMTKRKLDAAGIFYTEVDVTQDETALAYIKDTLGYTGAPVVYVSTVDGDRHWYGLRKDLLDHFIAYAEAA
ncbi:thioredoxin domain [Arthrobacter phage Shoya]|uniref:NrdH-like glutaredoxin n=1 Tax=Arthrobacter phage Shoya TaxID=2704035 RepID=A0A6G6XI39_9CAUD|nr:thioredoxin domain [Arthrobacter phage Shoya]QIG57727.1 NrdH-like glutaredoxin [Arthrobacter phage Shoya]